MVAGWLAVVVVADNRKQRARGSDKTRPRARTAIPMHTPQYPLRAGNTHGQDGEPRARLGVERIQNEHPAALGPRGPVLYSIHQDQSIARRLQWTEAMPPSARRVDDALCPSRD